MLAVVAAGSLGVAGQLLYSWHFKVEGNIAAGVDGNDDLLHILGDKTESACTKIYEHTWWSDVGGATP